CVRSTPCTTPTRSAVGRRSSPSRSGSAPTSPRPYSRWTSPGCARWRWGPACGSSRRSCCWPSIPPSRRTAAPGGCGRALPASLSVSSASPTAAAGCAGSRSARSATSRRARSAPRAF
ncbi:MAG: hypothetical protein AVDCRST_MAG21-1826, partial [uncultured Nocardioidaceae bacterium]